MLAVTQPTCVTSLQDEWKSLDRPPEGIIDQLVGTFCILLLVHISTKTGETGLTGCLLIFMHSSSSKITQYCKCWVAFPVFGIIEVKDFKFGT